MMLRSFTRSTQALPFSPMAASVDRPIAALLEDLRQRGLAENILVVWTTEFGRTPFSRARSAATTIAAAS
jgi:membrane-anchored protein YejM (alkaline phosphatase superfamily)